MIELNRSCHADHALFLLLLCRSTLVVDDIEEARDLCYNRSDHHKVVTVDGTLFKPNGTFTGTLESHLHGYTLAAHVEPVLLWCLMM